MFDQQEMLARALMAFKPQGFNEGNALGGSPLGASWPGGENQWNGWPTTDISQFNPGQAAMAGNFGQAAAAAAGASPQVNAMSPQMPQGTGQPGLSSESDPNPVALAAKGVPPYGPIPGIAAGPFNGLAGHWADDTGNPVGQAAKGVPPYGPIPGMPRPGPGLQGQQFPAQQPGSWGNGWGQGGQWGQQSGGGGDGWQGHGGGGQGQGDGWQQPGGWANPGNGWQNQGQGGQWGGGGGWNKGVPFGLGG